MTARTKPAAEPKSSDLEAKKRACIQAIAALTRRGAHASLSQIADRTQLSIAQMAQALTLLEMDGNIVSYPGGEYGLPTLTPSDYLAPNNSGAASITDAEADRLLKDVVWNVLGGISRPRQKPMDAAAIAVLTDMPVETVQAILTEMIAQGIVHEVAPPTDAATTLGDRLQPAYSSVIRSSDASRAATIRAMNSNSQPSAASIPTPTPPHTSTTEIELSRIIPSSLNCRKSFSDASLKDLAASLTRTGLLLPIIVRPVKDGYEVIAGERRYRAALLAGLTHIRADIRELSDEDAALVNTTENLCREDLNPIETACCYRRLSEAGYTQDQIAEITGRSQPVIANAIRLLDLPPDAQEFIATGALTNEHGKLLASYSKFPDVASGLANLAVKNKWPCDQLKSQPHKAHLYEINSLYDEPVLYNLSSHPTVFDTSVCRKCPFDAYRAGVCMYPPHYLELNNAALALRKARQEELLAPRDTTHDPVDPGARYDATEVVAGFLAPNPDPTRPIIEPDAHYEAYDVPVLTPAVPPIETDEADDVPTLEIEDHSIAISPVFTPDPAYVPGSSTPAPEPQPAPIHLDDLDIHQYELLDRKFDQVEGCGVECPCRRIAMNHYGDTIVPICIDPAHRAELREAARRARMEPLQKAFDDRLLSIHHAIDASPYMAACLLAAEALRRADLCDITAACERHGQTKLAEVFTSLAFDDGRGEPFTLTSTAYHALTTSNLPAQLLTIIAAEAALLHDAARILDEFGKQNTFLCDLVLPALPHDPEAEGRSAAEMQIARLNANENDLRHQVKELQTELAQLRAEAEGKRVDPTTTLVYRNLQSDRDHLHAELTRLKTENLKLRSTPRLQPTNGSCFPATNATQEAAK